MWVRFLTEGVLHNGYIFRPPTHTSGHFILESPPHPHPWACGLMTVSQRLGQQMDERRVGVMQPGIIDY